ncbi:MAG: neutral/alkaline non-lysosomal ceramidase N-terminal domain-containing protein [Pirellulaceae bacterium]|nr:neutral/alkaline non-lysosomal ceramidase N-terminal domain-containing protein [Pirellulaceae bacterium]
MFRLFLLACLACISCTLRAADVASEIRDIGIAKVDITPDYPVRLTGYGSRREESEGVELRIWAKALAIGSDTEGPALIVTVDNCGIPYSMRTEVLSRLSKKAGIRSERFAICFSHTHCAPCLTGALVNIFSSDIPPLHQANIDRYTRSLTDQLEAISLAALADRKPSRLSWSVGEVRFANNRRVAWGGPVDHALPTLFVHSPTGELRGVLANYACHATTLSINRIHGDWPGTAMEAIEREHPGVIAMISIGCGADQNPNPRSTIELASQHGLEVATEVSRLLKSNRATIRGELAARETSISLPLAPLPTRMEWETLAASPSHQVSYSAQKNLARLDRDEQLSTAVPYRILCWQFGSDLAMVFLPGEVTIDYQVRLKSEWRSSRIWVNAYSNDAPCYIPSQRVLEEGGYEGATAMVYYDQPAKFADGIEDKIIAAVLSMAPEK